LSQVQTFIKDINIDEDNTIIVKSTILLAHSLNLQIIAEGVETKEQLIFLQDHACDQFQGFYFSKPIGADAMLKLLNK
jgi:EAL domain-containing protein (putative c-di-GMP-specific phosphodiesterase class I)